MSFFIYLEKVDEEENAFYFKEIVFCDITTDHSTP